MQTLEEYCKKHESDEGFNFFYQRLIEDGKEKTFEQIININPYYRIIDFDSSFFSDQLVKLYGVEVLLKLQNRIDIESLRLGLCDAKIKQKIVYFAYFTPAFDIKKHHVLSSKFSIELLEKAKSIFDSFELLCFTKMLCFAENGDIKEFMPFLEDEESLFKIRYMMTHTTDFFFSHVLHNKEFFRGREGTIFVKALIASNYDELPMPNALFRIFDTYKQLFTDERVIKAKTLATFIKEKNRSEYTMETPEDLINFDVTRRARSRFLSEEEKIKFIFGITSEELFKRINNYLEKDKKYKFLTADEIIRLMNLSITQDSKDFLDEIEKKYRAICKKDIASSLIIPKGTGTIDITDKDFRAIIHQIRFNGPNSMGRKFMTDPNIWNTGEIEGGYLSGTLATHYSLGTIGETKDNIIGLSKIKPSDILDMGLQDIFSSIYYYYNGLKNPLSDFRTHEDFEHSTGCAYNEVTLRRFRKGVSLKPDFTLAFDKVSEFNKMMQEFFRIPIFYIDSMRSARRMNAHNEALLCANKLREYGIYLYRFYVSYMNNPDIVDKFFNKTILEDTLNTIIKNYQSFENKEDREAILFILTIMKKINDGLVYYNPYAKLVDIESFRKRLI